MYKNSLIYVRSTLSNTLTLFRCEIFRNLVIIVSVPGPIRNLEAYPMGSSAFFLVWKKPAQPNGVLTGYKIFYQIVNGMQVEALRTRTPHITDPNQLTAKLSGLQADTKYRIHVRATTRAGEGDSYYIEQRTRVSGVIQPDIPTFTWYRQPTENGLATIKVVWNVRANEKPGSHFFIKYRIKGKYSFINLQHVIVKDAIGGI